ncbi:hypothetical protein LASUN_18740 [Lentilactobacillus sunkii]|uniref:Uncharacterized protein n=1 Tax=Lentilactobacillus sunkii TaxID=481719 RepID=A0A1E7XAV6_9LACO|nr:hypothetical protein LASUN_18740 [Lentilactobacillus sunkii]
MNKKERLIMAFSIVIGYVSAQYLMQTFIKIQNPTPIPTQLVNLVIFLLIGYPLFLLINTLLKWFFRNISNK